jgi:hypothetical protein
MVAVLLMLGFANSQIGPTQRGNGALVQSRSKASQLCILSRLRYKISY